jgi:hypothetical protein
MRCQPPAERLDRPRRSTCPLAARAMMVEMRYGNVECGIGHTDPARYL